MADEKHLAILKQGVESWNKWREENPEIEPDLTRANLSRAKLSRANLSRAWLELVNFIDADLSHTDLGGARLYEACFIDSVLRGANLSGADLSHADLSRADLSDAELGAADLRGAEISGADLSGASIGAVNFLEANLQDTDFTGAVLIKTIFNDTDLSRVKGLDTVHHYGPSEISISTLYKSGGNIPEEFLRGCGVPDDFITFARSLISKAIEFYSCFISYSSKNQAFAERLYADLQSKGVRCWFAPEDLKIGAKIRVGIDESIRMHDKLLLVLSKQSVGSERVEKEVETAMEQESNQKRTVLFPVMLDNSLMKIESGWPADIRRSRNIGDFRKWKDHDSYSKAFTRLLRDLKA